MKLPVAFCEEFHYNDSIHFKYIKEIKDNLYCKGKNLISYSLKFVPNDSKTVELKNLIEFLEK